VLTALERGRIYTWSVRAVNEQGQVSEVTSQGKFKVLSADKTNEIARLKRSQSHLALGLFYAREGMIDKATAELRIVVRQNPDSAVALKLLNTIQSWRKR
jgi:Tfp pilus assembly protein PilF